MAKVIYMTHDGARFDAQLADGVSVMSGALDHNIPGIIGECGGAAACATCRVRVDAEWVTTLPPPELFEQSMLEDYGSDTGDIRLSCQIRMTAGFDGLVVHIPESQQ